MPGHRFYNPNLSSGKFSKEESHHAVDVLRLRSGDSAAIFDGKGTEARVRLTQVSAEEVSYETLSTARTPPPSCRIRFGQALIKPVGMDLLIQKLTELGVSEIWPIASERSVSKPSGEKRISHRWESIALSACKQSGQNWLPKIYEAGPLDNFLSAPNPAPFWQDHRLTPTRSQTSARSFGDSSTSRKNPGLRSSHRPGRRFHPCGNWSCPLGRISTRLSRTPRPPIRNGLPLSRLRPSLRVQSPPLKAQLVCTDFDGTLAGENPDEPLAPEFFRWLSSSRKIGEISWVVATGRSWESLREALVFHKAPVMPDWIVTVEREIHQVKEGQAHSLEAWNKCCTETHQALFGRHGALLERIEREIGSTDEVTVIPDAGAIGLVAGSQKASTEPTLW